VGKGKERGREGEEEGGGRTKGMENGREEKLEEGRGGEKLEQIGLGGEEKKWKVEEGRVGGERGRVGKL